MLLYIKLIVLCISGGVLHLLVKRHSPEIAFLIIVASVLASLYAALEIIDHIKALLREINLFTYISTDLFVPLLKCLGVSVLKQISCALCKDAGQSAAGVGIEFTGNLVLILCIVPMIAKLFELLGGLM